MKKLLCVLLTLLATVCLLSTVVSAAPPPPQLAADLQSMTYNGQTYSATDLSAMNLYFDNGPFSIEVPKSLQSQVRFATMSSTSNSWVISVEVNYLNGSTLNLTYVREDVLPELQQICQGDEVVCFVDFWWESPTSVETSIKQLKGKPATLTHAEVRAADYYDVIYDYQALDTWVYRGFICQNDGRFYYVDYQENNIYSPMSFYPDIGPDLYKAYEITDPALVSQIQSAIESEFSGSSKLGQMLSSALLIFLFAIIPAVILILSIIFFLRTKAYYRITWAVTGGLCIAELILFVILSLIL